MGRPLKAIGVDAAIHVNVQNTARLSGCMALVIVFSSCASSDLRRLFCRVPQKSHVHKRLVLTVSSWRVNSTWLSYRSLSFWVKAMEIATAPPTACLSEDDCARRLEEAFTALLEDISGDTDFEASWADAAKVLWPTAPTTVFAKGQGYCKSLAGALRSHVKQVYDSHGARPAFNAAVDYLAAVAITLAEEPQDTCDESKPVLEIDKLLQKVSEGSASSQKPLDS